LKFINTFPSLFLALSFVASSEKAARKRKIGHKSKKEGRLGKEAPLFQSFLAPTLALRTAFCCSPQSKCLEQAILFLTFKLAYEG